MPSYNPCCSKCGTLRVNPFLREGQGCKKILDVGCYIASQLTSQDAHRGRMGWSMVSANWLGGADHITMGPGSCSRRSWADEVEEKESTWGAGRFAFPELPPLVAATHASLVLWASSLDPKAEPFTASLGGSEEKLHFTNLEASFYDSDTPPSSGRGKAAVLPWRQHRRSRCCVRQGSLLWDARRTLLTFLTSLCAKLSSLA